MIWFFIFIPIIASILLLVFFSKKVTLWEIALLVFPTALIILLMNTIMVSYRTSDTEYLGSYITKVNYYEAWDEEVSCRHSYDCNCSTDKDGKRSCSTCYEHSYDVDYHPEHWTKEDNMGCEYEISKSTYDDLKSRFATNTYFVELNRDYHSIDGNAYSTNWAGEPLKSEVITKEHSYTNKVQVSHSIFKFDEIDEKTKLKCKLYDYPVVSGYYQPIVLGYNVDVNTNRKLQYMNGFYGKSKQFKMFILFFKNQSMDVSFKQRSYWQGGNKNEFTICIGTDNSGKLDWVKCFSWMDKPELEVEVQNYFTEKGKIDLSDFADWMPKQIEQHWHRKQFKDFDYLEIEVTDTQMWWILIIVVIYNIGMSIWIVVNEFDSIGNLFSSDNKRNSDTSYTRNNRIVKKSAFQEKLEQMQRMKYGINNKDINAEIKKDSLMQKIRNRFYGEN